jgi:hypothetical protein
LKIKILQTIIILSSFTLLAISHYPVYGETFRLQIDDKVYDVEYKINGDVIAMDIDKEVTSLLIATENVQDSEFQITLPNELIRAEKNEFAVLVNGLEVNYGVIDDVDNHLTFFVPAFTEEIEIIGTFVVPEFPLGSLLVLATVVGIIIIFQKSKKFLFK